MSGDYCLLYEIGKNGLFVLLHLSLQLSEYVDVAECCAGSNVLGAQGVRNDV